MRLKREELDISLRELARRLSVSAPFISDVELGRRYPGDEVLAKIAAEFDVSIDQLKGFDSRESLAEFKRVLDANPNVAVAFRTAVKEYKEGRLSPEDLVPKPNKAKRQQ